jgi:hypothetical protein
MALHIFNNGISDADLNININMTTTNIPKAQRKLRPGWSVETKEAKVVHGRHIAGDGFPPEWVDKHKTTLMIMKSHKAIYTHLPEDMAIDTIAALGSNGRITTAYDPANADVWFLFSYSYKSNVFIYNGEQAIPCVFVNSKEKEGLEEVWIDTSKTITLFPDIQEALDEMVSEYIS